MNRIVKSATVAGIALASAAVMAPRAAHAQTNTLQPVQRPISVKAGLGFPTDGDTDAVFKAGATYDFTKSAATQPTLFNVYADYQGKGSQHYFGGGVGMKYIIGTPLAPSVPYVGAGLGIYGTHVAGSSDKTSLGGKVLAGYQFNGGYFAEADYTILSKNNGVNPGGFGLALGYRF